MSTYKDLSVEEVTCPMHERTLLYRIVLELRLREHLQNSVDRVMLENLAGH